MENITFLSPAHTCNCQNQHLLEFGKTCNICMGVVRTVQNVLEDILPETQFDDQGYIDYWKPQAYLFAAIMSLRKIKIDDFFEQADLSMSINRLNFSR